MSLNHDQTLMEIINSIDGITLKEKKGAKFRFLLHLTREMCETPISELDLGVRAYNSLCRAGYHRIEELADAIASGSDLNRIRGCGKSSIREIMEHLFLFQYNSLPPEKREAYLVEVVAVNLLQ